MAAPAPAKAAAAPTSTPRPLRQRTPLYKDPMFQLLLFRDYELVAKDRWAKRACLQP